MERGNPRTDDKGVYQAEEPQDKSTNAVMGADLVVVVKKLLQWKWSEEQGLSSFESKSTLKGGGAYARNKAVQNIKTCGNESVREGESK